MAAIAAAVSSVWAWAPVCVASIPFGGMVYLLVGRVHR